MIMAKEFLSIFLLEIVLRKIMFIRLLKPQIFQDGTFLVLWTTTHHLVGLKLNAVPKLRYNVVEHIFKTRVGRERMWGLFLLSIS